MKVLMIAPEEFYDETGTPLSVFHRIRALVDIGHQVDLVTYHLGKRIKIKNTNIYRISNLPFIKRIRIGPSLAKLPLDGLLFLKSLSLLMKGDYDCIHTHEEAALFGGIFKRLFGLPHIYDMHSSLPEQLINYDFTKNKFLIWLMAVIEKWIIKNSDYIIVVYEHLKGRVSCIEPNRKVTLIENTTQAWEFKEPSLEKTEQIRKELSLKGKKVVLYTGTFEANQGIKTMLMSVPLVIKEEPQVIYLLVGGKLEHIEEIKRLAREFKVEDYVRTTGMKPLAEMPNYLGVAEILISPREKGTNTPLKIYSYLASKKPIVATNLLAHTQVLNEKVALLVEPTKEGLAKGVITLLKNESLRKRLVEGAERLVKEKYTYHRFLDLTKEVYDYIASLRN